jgi:hypothetical protein
VNPSPHGITLPGPITHDDSGPGNQPSGASTSTWKLRSVFQTLNGSDEITPASFAAAKRHKPDDYQQQRQMACEQSKSHARIEAQRYDDLLVVDDLVQDLNPRRRNASSAFFVTHEALREYMGFACTADIVSLDDAVVIEWNAKLNARARRPLRG